MNLMSSRYGIEIKYPFFEKNLMQYCLSIPIDYKLKSGFNRHLLRKAMRGIVPDKVLLRKTKSNLSPFSRIEIEKFNKDYILNEIRNNIIFDEGNIKNLLNEKVDSSNMIEIYLLIQYLKWAKINLINY